MAPNPDEGAIRFGVLGPVSVTRDDRPIPMRSEKQRAVLSVLLLRANRTVSTERLIDEVWGPQPPPSARELVATYIWRLRSLLGDVRGEGARLRGEPAGYRLRVGEGELDVAKFDRLFAEGRTLLAAGDALRAAVALRAALQLWRGDPLWDTPLHGELSGEVVELSEQRSAALECRIEADLAAGRHDVVIGELRRLVEQSPGRERFAAQLMTALYRAGRRRDALAVFRDLRRLLVRDLGVEPGREAASVHEAILRDDPGLYAAGTLPRSPRHDNRPRPAQLPFADRSFRGRRDELDRLDALLAAHLSGTDNAPLLAVITGTAGVGKTSLAVHWAHRVRERFPDGQLFANLRETSSGVPPSPLPILSRFLRDLGVPGAQLPVDSEEVSAQYRTVLADLRVLIVIDDAADAACAAALLPANRASAVLVTSRDPLSELSIRYGAKRITLRPFAASESRALLTGSLAAAPRRGDGAFVDELAGLCGHLPLALRLAAAHLDDHPALTVGEYVAQIRRGDRLAALDGEHDTVRGAFDLSYRALSAADARAFRLLGLFLAHGAAVPAAAALLDLTDAEAGRTLDRLARARLLDGDSGRFAMHDLLRAYAAGLAEREELAASRDDALDRWLDWCLDCAVAADEILDPFRYRAPLRRTAPPRLAPAFATRRDALALLDAERANLVAAVFQAARHQRLDVAWKLAWALLGYFDLRKSAMDWLDTYRLGVSCAQAAGDGHGEAVMMYGLGLAHYHARRFAEALDCYHRAVRLHQDCGDRRGEGVTLNSIANVHLEALRYEEALHHYRLALAIHQLDGNRRDEGVVLSNLSEAYNKLSMYKEAESHAERALVIQRETDNRRVEAFTLCNLANARWGSDRSAQAEDLIRGAIAIAQDIGDRHAWAWALTYLGQIMRDGGRLDEARRAWRQAADLFTDLGDPNVAEVRARLAGADRQSSGLARAGDRAGRTATSRR